MQGSKAILFHFFSAFEPFAACGFVAILEKKQSVFSVQQNSDVNDSRWGMFPVEWCHLDPRGVGREGVKLPSDFLLQEKQSLCTTRGCISCKKTRILFSICSVL